MARGGSSPEYPPWKKFSKYPPRILSKSVLNHAKIDIFEPPLENC